MLAEYNLEKEVMVICITHNLSWPMKFFWPTISRFPRCYVVVLVAVSDDRADVSFVLTIALETNIIS